jgi:hypothetical protein
MKIISKSKSRLVLLTLASIPLCGMPSFAHADDAHISSYEGIMQASTEGRSSPAWKEGWTALVYSTVLESCAKGFFVNVMKNSRPQSWWPGGPSAPAKIPSGMLWGYAALEQPKLMQGAFTVCLCTTEVMARNLKFSDVPAFQNTTRASELGNECAKKAQQS